MIKGSFSNGKGNAESIKSKRIKGHIFPIRRLEYLFDFLAEEPDSIFVKENENSEENLQNIFKKLGLHGLTKIPKVLMIT